MPFQIVRNDITKMKTDAIVNAANASLLGGGGVDGAVHRAAGPKLLEECRTLGGCGTGQAVITRGYDLLCRYVIHTVGPVWQGGQHGEAGMLRSCYRTSLELAEKHGCESIAFPLISAGAFGYPCEEALEIAVQTIGDFLQQHDMMVWLVIFDRKSFQIGKKRFSEIAAYIDDHYVEVHFDSDPYLSRDRRAPKFEPDISHSRAQSAGKRPFEKTFDEDALSVGALPTMHSNQEEAAYYPSPGQPGERTCDSSLEEALEMIDESFSEMLLRKIDESGMTDVACYRKANIDRRLFSKIRSNPFYRPSRQTVLAFAIALELSLDETREMLGKAGFSLSGSNKADIIVQYFIEHGNYNLFEINEALFEFDQPLLGA